MIGTMDRQPSDRPSRGDLNALLRATSSGDSEAFEALYGRTSAKLYGICLRLLGNEAEAQDVLQDTYVRVWQKADTFDATKASPITWLAIVARNKAIDRLRQRTPLADDIDAADEIADGGPTAIEVIEHRQDSERLTGCLDELEERSRDAIRAAFLDGVTYPQLAEREGVPLGTMKSWIRRGLQRLRACLER
ncbi:MAG: sigma-70 family RNA polymerase sigma factor [Sphingomonas sp.]|nr:sigma-70 family RNA polymerase sigma factor [Sphingomonas sp.]